MMLNLKFASPTQRVGYIVGNAGFLETILQGNRMTVGTVPPHIEVVSTFHKQTSMSIGK